MLILIKYYIFYINIMVKYFVIQNKNINFATKKYFIFYFIKTK